jgi:hypothetical protein
MTGTIKKIPAPDDHLTTCPNSIVAVSISGRVGGACWRPIIHARIISAAGIQVVIVTIVKIPAPDDHFISRPDGCVAASGGRRVGRASRCPTIAGWIVFAASIHIAAIVPAPDDHLAAGPHCCVRVTAAWCVRCGGSYPAIHAGIVSPAGIQIVGAIESSPHDHFATGPYCRV